MMRRRWFLQVSSVGGTGLLLGFHMWGCKKSKKKRRGSAAEAANDPKSKAAESHEINAWIRIDSDDSITLIVAESEMGQGVLTALPMILAEELEADWQKVRSKHALADSDKYGRQSTGGSTSVRDGLDDLRRAGAAAREMLIAAAAKRWKVAAGECRAAKSTVVHEASGKRASYGELAADAAKQKPPKRPALKDPAKFELIGKPVERLDLAAKVDGSAVFGIDVVRPGMLTAQVVRSPVFGGVLRRFDASSAKKVPGVREVVEIPSGGGVVAEHFWAAQKGREALQITWEEGAAAQLTNRAITAQLNEVCQKGVEVRKGGNPDRAIRRAKRTVKAVYQVPYLAHAPMEPLNCTADVRADRCEIWAPTQSPSAAQEKAAEITGLPMDKVTVHTTFLGGGFGRRLQTDFVEDAVRLSEAVGAPVKLVYTREDGVRGGYYRPIAYNELEGAVDADGWPSAWVHRVASPAILDQFGPLPRGVDDTAIEGAANLPYGIPNIRVTYAAPDLPITTWFWRSVGSSQNAYVTECFLDELAAAGGKDPLEVRQRLLAKKPRHKRVLEVAAEKAGWGSPLPEGVARGIAVHESFGSFVAQVAEVSKGSDGAVRVRRVVCAVDCGDVVNPDTIAAQMEGGIVFGLSAALYGKIDIVQGCAVQSNFDSYKLLRINEMPDVETHIVARGDPLGGIGEPGTPPIAPAVCNALFALTGEPVRTLPISARRAQFTKT